MSFSEKQTYDFNYEDFEIKDISIAYAYRDQQGRIWGFTYMSYSHRSYPSPYIDNRPYYVNRSLTGWVCLSDPSNGDIPAFNPAPLPTKWRPDSSADWSVEATVWPPANPSEFEIASSNAPNIPLIIILAAAFFAGTAAVVWLFLKRGKRGSLSE